MVRGILIERDLVGDNKWSSRIAAQDLVESLFGNAGRSEHRTESL